MKAQFGFPKELTNVLEQMDLKIADVNWTLSKTSDETKLVVTWKDSKTLPSQSVQPVHKPRYKSPSQLRRDRERKQQWLQKTQKSARNQEWKRNQPVSSTVTAETVSLSNIEKEQCASENNSVNNDYDKHENCTENSVFIEENYVFKPPFEELNNIDLIDVADPDLSVKDELQAVKTKLREANVNLRFYIRKSETLERQVVEWCKDSAHKIIDEQLGQGVYNLEKGGPFKPLSLHELRDLALAVHKLPEHSINGLVDLIQAFEPGMQDPDELDIDPLKLRPMTARMMRKYVDSVLRKI